MNKDDAKKQRSYFLSFGRNFKLLGEDALVRLGDICGYGSGKIKDEKVYPSTKPLLIKDGEKYTLINRLDQRVHSLLSEFDFNTLVNCFVIDETETQLSVEDIEFLAGEILSNQGSRLKLKDTFTEILKSKHKQKLIERHVCGSSHLNDSVLSFSTTRFVKLIGENTVTKSTIDSWLAANVTAPIFIFFSLIPSCSIPLSSDNFTTSDFKYLLRTDPYRHCKNYKLITEILNTEQIAIDLKLDLQWLNYHLAVMRTAQELTQKWFSLNLDIELKKLLATFDLRDDATLRFMTALNELDTHNEEKVIELSKSIQNFYKKLEANNQSRKEKL